MRHGELFAGEAVNWGASLNRGLTSWWLPIPGQQRGNVFRDLCLRNHGTLTNGPTWSGLSHAGGYGSVKTVAASSQMIDCGTPAGLNSATKCSYSGWIYRGSTGETAGFGATAGTSATATTARFSFIWYSDGNLYWIAGNGTDGGYSSVALSGTGWHHVACVYDGSQSTDATRLKFWIDGVSQAFSLGGGSTSVPTALGNVGPWTIGRDASNRYCDGQYDDARLAVGTAWADDIPPMLYLASRQGYPNELNWYRRQTVIDLNAGGTATGFNYLTLLGVGGAAA